MSTVKRIYTFGNKQAEGKADMKNLLGGKGANLAEMNLIGVPVPPGFTITTDVCTEYNQLGKEEVIKLLKAEAEAAMKNVEDLSAQPLVPGPNSVGFDYHFGVPNNIDWLPKVYIENEEIWGLRSKGKSPYGKSSYKNQKYHGYDAPQRVTTKVTGDLNSKAREWIFNYLSNVSASFDVRGVARFFTKASKASKRRVFVSLPQDRSLRRHTLRRWVPR